MALKIRLRQQGRKNRRMYRLVVADDKSKRDGKYVDALGWYNPHEDTLEKKLFVDAAKTEEWLSKGAQLTDSSRTIVAKGAPELMQRVIKRENERREKIRAKRKAARKKRAERRNAAAPKAAVKAPTKAPAKPKAKAADKSEAKKPAAKKPAAKKEPKAEVKAEAKPEAEKPAE